MASWHFHCALVPRRAVTPELDVRECFVEGTAGLWRTTPASVVREALLVLGAPGATWDDATERWGEEEGTAILLTTIDGAVEDLRIRIDLQRDSRQFLEAMCAACEGLELGVLTEQGEKLALGRRTEPRCAAGARGGDGAASARC